MTLFTDLSGAAIIIAAFALVLIAAEAWARLGTPKPEWTRKVVHVGGGLIGLALPWLIESPLVVLLLTASLSALFVLGEKTGLLKALHGVSRKSRGSEYYPLAIWLVFVLASDKRWLYVSAVLVLAVADAFAALIGSRYGRLRYEVEDEHKSIEGSLVFFAIAFVVVAVPAWTMTTLPRGVVILSALLVAMLVTIFEAISLRGTDNLFVPIGVVFVLQKITTKSLDHIALQNLSLLAIVLLVALLAWRIEWFNAGGALTVILFVFAAWSLGPRFRWAIPVFIGLIGLALVRVYVLRRGERRRLKVSAVTRALIVPFFFLLAANMTSQFDRFYAPYLAACAAVFAFVAWTGGRSSRAPLVGSIAAVAVAVPMLAIYPASLATVLAIIVVVATMTSANARLSDPREWGAASFLLALFAGVAVLALQELRLIAAWGVR